MSLRKQSHMRDVSRYSTSIGTKFGRSSVGERKGTALSRGIISRGE